MESYWLTYTEDGWPPEKLRALVARFSDDPAATTEHWRFANRQAKAGARVFLFKQGRDPRGIFGVGSIVSEPRLHERYEDDLDGYWRAEVRFDELVNPLDGDFLLSLDDVKDVLTRGLVIARRSGQRIQDPAITAELERRIATRQQANSLSSSTGDDGSFDPDTLGDHRERAFRAITVRRGQQAFRDALLRIYEGRCAISGCEVLDVLEAAHISPYLGSATNDSTNGLLLRSDLHTLFDCGRLSIDPDTRTVQVDSALIKTSYGDLAGLLLRAPSQAKSIASRKALMQHYSAFRRRCSR